MNVIFDDFVDGLFHQVQQKVVPALESVTQKATQRLSDHLHAPPSSTDLVYITDRLVVLSQPAICPDPTYLDSGRDVQREARQRPQLAREVSTLGNSSQASSTDQDNDKSDEDDDADAFNPQDPVSMATDEEVASQTQQEPAPADPLNENPSAVSNGKQDLTPTIIETKGESDEEPGENVPQRIDSNDENDTGPEDSKTAPSIPLQHQRGSAIKNSAATIVSYLDKRHGMNSYLAFSLADERPDDRTLLLFRRQIVRLGWWSPCIQRSETPSISKVLKVCYAIHTYLQLDPANTALVYCSNGKTRTGIVIACYLKFANLVQHSYEGFFHFLAKRGIKNPEATWKQLPPSLRLFFRQFDSALNMGGFLNQKPLLLRAIALQGVPVEDKPCLDIWDSSQRHVYSSHPENWNLDFKGTAQQSESSQWADEEGFYKVNALLEGDFLLLCRFGGEFARETTVHDPSKILFRYTNTTGFLSGGFPYELPPSKVDLARSYANHLDDEDFMVSLLFEGDWEQTGIKRSSEDHQHLKTPGKVCGERIWQCHEKGTFEEGFNTIFQYHSARPNHSDVEDFQRFHRNDLVQDCSSHLICIALQLTNFHYKKAEVLLLESPSLSWWHQQPRSNKTDGANASPPEEDEVLENNRNIKKRSVLVGAECAQSIFGVLDEIDVTKNLSPNVISMVNDYKPSQHAAQASLDYEVTSIQKNDSLRNRAQAQSMDICLRDSGWMIPGLGYPRRGDITGRFGNESLKADCVKEQATTRQSRSFPKVPYFPREGPALLPPSSKRRRTGLPNVDQPLRVLPFDRKREVAMQLFIHLRHTGVTLPGLIGLLEASEALNKVPGKVEPSNEKEEGGIEGVDNEANLPNVSRGLSMNRKSKEQKEKEWADARKAEEDVKTKNKEMGKKEEKDQSGLPQNKDGHESEVPLKDNPDYSKYFKMLKMGMAKEQVEHAMKRDEKDPNILDLDPNLSLKSQVPDQPENVDGEVPLKNDPEYLKYFKMLKMGLPVDAVKNALARDGKDPSIMDLDPEKSIKAQRKGNGNDDGPPLKDDPEYAKYFKMLKMGLPVDAVKNALTRDGKDPGIMDLDPNLSIKSQEGSSEDTGVPLKDDPEYTKYFKMLKMGLPVDAVKNALVRDGKDPKIMDLDPNLSIKSQQGGSEDTGVPLKDDPEYSKYFKMLKMGLPLDAVKNALTRDGKDPTVMDLDPSKSVQAASEDVDTGTPLKDDPEYAKYFKMRSMGLPVDAVKNALTRDGKDPGIMDMDPTKSVAFQTKASASSKKSPAKKKKRVRRKKIYWNPINPAKLKEDSMWNIVKDAVTMTKLNYDQREFEELFTESADPKEKKKKKTETTAKKLVQVIDGKKSMNGGIILARLKMEYSTIAEIVTKMDHNKFDSTQLTALKGFLPDADERRGLSAYMQNPKVPRESLYADLSETEKYMVTMMEVPEPERKFDAMLFRSMFKNRFEDINSGIQTLNTACDQLRTSEKFRKLMAMILTVVNQINTGGEGNMAIGFTLDALLKLNEAKAFDKKTSVLHYVVKLVKKNNESLLTFSNDISFVIPAESVLLDALGSDVKALGEELVGVHKTVQDEAQRLEEAGELKPMSLEDLKEQKTTVRQVGKVSQFNKIDHHTGRTSMERFTVNAHYSCEQANASIEDVKKKYIALLNYFGEDENMPTGDFFGILRRFMREFQKAMEQVEAIENKEAKEKKREAARAAKAARKGTKKDVSATDKKGRIRRSDKGSKQGGNAASKRDKSPSNAINRTEGKEQTRSELLAAMAATAASREKVEEANDPVGGSRSPSGIAAMAAAAALGRKDNPSDLDDEKPNTKIPALITPNSNEPMQEVLAAGISHEKSRETEKGRSSEAEESASKLLIDSNGSEPEHDPRQEIFESESKKSSTDSNDKEKVEDVEGSRGSNGPSHETRTAGNTREERNDNVEQCSHPSSGVDVSNETLSKKRTNTGVEENAAESFMRSSTSDSEHDPRQEMNAFETKEVVPSLSQRLSDTRKEEMNDPNGPGDSDYSTLIAPAPSDSKQARSEKSELLPAAPHGLVEVDVSKKPLAVMGTISEVEEITDESLLPSNADEPEDDGRHEVSDADRIEAKSDFAAKAAAYRKRRRRAGKDRSTSPSGVDRPKSPSGSDRSSTPPGIDLSRSPSRIDRSKSPSHFDRSESPSMVHESIHPHEASVRRNLSSPDLSNPTRESKFLQSAAVYRKRKSSRNLARTADPKKVPAKEASSPTTGGKQEDQPPSTDGKQADVVHKGSTSHVVPDAQSNLETKVDATEQSTPVVFANRFPSPMEARRSSIRVLNPLGAPRLSDFLDAASRDSATRVGSGLGDFLEGKRAGLGDFLDLNAVRDDQSEMLRQNYDDSSVAQIADRLHRTPMGARMSTNWTEGDNITNWMGWADQIVKASDTDSVLGFEMPRDLNDGNFDFDDDSTIASHTSYASSYYDDMSVASGIQTPGRVSSFISFDNQDMAAMDTSFDPYYENVETQEHSTSGPAGATGITPAKVAASILFEDSPPTSVEFGLGDHQGYRQYETGALPMNIPFAGEEVGLDTGLTFGPDVGFDDGLEGFGGTESFNDFGGNGLSGLGMPSTSNPESEQEPGKKDTESKRKWFPWAGGG